MVDGIRLLRRLFYRAYEPSRDTARRRLQLVLVQDRIGLPASAMEALKRHILEVVSRYLVIDEESVEMELRHSAGATILASNIPVKDIVRTGAVG